MDRERERETGKEMDRGENKRKTERHRDRKRERERKIDMGGKSIDYLGGNHLLQTSRRPPKRNSDQGIVLSGTAAPFHWT